MKWILTLALTVLVTGVAHAEKWDKGCRTQATATTATTESFGSQNIGNGEIACWTVADTAGTDDALNELSPLFLVTATAAQVCFDSDVAATTAGTAVISLRVCPHGERPSSNPDQQCHPIIALSEANCLGIEPGAYYFQYTTIATNGSLDTARAVVRGLGGIGD